MQYTDDQVYRFLRHVVEEKGSATGSDIRDMEVGPTERTISKHYGSVGKALAEAGVRPDGYDVCPDCGGYFMHVGKHISRKECELPDIDEHQWDLLVGVLMGDGYVAPNSAGNPSFGVSMVKDEFIYWLQDELCPLSNSVSVTNHVDKQDEYSFDTTPHDRFDELRGWYSSGEKRYPDNLELNQTRLKMWYVTDGGWSNGYPSIATHNESDRSEFIVSLFDDLSFEVRWENNEVHVCSDQIDIFFDYVGDPPPGFEYKWPKEYK